MQAIDQPSAPFETVLYNARTLVEDSMMSRRGPEIHFRLSRGARLGLAQRLGVGKSPHQPVLQCRASHAARGTISVDARRYNGSIQIVVAMKAAASRRNFWR